jgi:hypothetical protein
MIDVIDLTSFINFVSYPRAAISHWKISSQNNSSYPSITVTAREDSVLAGDSVTIDIILGDSLIAIDSIYSIAIGFQSDWLFYSSSERLIIPISDLGDTAVDLFAYNYPQMSLDYKNVLLSKTNHQNVTLFRDTIATFRIPAPSGYLTKHYRLTPVVNAITKEGFQVNLTAATTDSIYYSDRFLSTSVLNNMSVDLFPNPSDGNFNITNINLFELKINVTDVTGRIIKTEISNNELVRVDLTEFQNGIYFVQIVSPAGSLSKTIFIQR